MHMSACSLNTGWLRQSIAIVEQTPTLINGSIFENIIVGNPGATFEDVVQAAKLVCMSSVSGHLKAPGVGARFHHVLPSRFARFVWTSVSI